MKPTDDGNHKIVVTVMIAIGLFFAIVALAITCSRPAQAAHTGEPTVSMGVSAEGVEFINIDATKVRSEGCGLRTDNPDFAGLFYEFVTDKITVEDWLIRAPGILSQQGWPVPAAEEFAQLGVLYCNKQKES